VSLWLFFPVYPGRVLKHEIIHSTHCKAFSDNNIASHGCFSGSSLFSSNKALFAVYQIGAAERRVLAVGGLPLGAFEYGSSPVVRLDLSAARLNL
jgi:hypothetical protein